MSNGGTFVLVVNSGTTDDILLSSEILHKRLEKVREERIRNVTETHHIKLFSLEKGLENNLKAINKIRANVGYNINDINSIDPMDNPTSANTLYERELFQKLVSNNNGISQEWKDLRQQRYDMMKEKENVKKEIQNLIKNNDNIQPSMADISKTHINFLYKTFKPFVALGFQYTHDDPIGSNYDFGQNFKYRIKNFGEFTHDQVLHVQLTGMSNINPADKVRYCNYLGHRLIEKISIKINGQILDEYNSERYNNYFNYELPTNKRSGWLNSIGHSLPKYGYMTSDPSFQFSEVRYIVDGPQTLKSKHDVVDVFIPLLFWYNTDIALSLPNQIIPGGQIEVNVQFANVDKICAYDNASGSDAGFVKPKITIARMYSNHIYLNPEIHDLLLNKVNFTMIRIHKQINKVLDKPNDDIQLLDLKFPIERMYFNFKPIENETGPNNMDLWHRNGKMEVNEIPTAGITIAPGPIYSSAVSFIRHYNETSTITALSLTAHGIKIYEDYPVQLFNSYLPYKFGTINTPLELGYYMINFDIKPGEYQPSGHFNCSKGREFFLSYRSNNISSNLPTYLQLTAITINFLVVKDGTAYLQYST